MKIFRLIGVGLAVLILTSQSHAQSSDEAERLYQQYLKAQKGKSEQAPQSYKSPDIYGDTMHAQKGEAQDIDMRALGSIQGDSMMKFNPELFDQSHIDSLMLFGYDMFAERSSSFAPPATASVPSDYRIGPGDNIIVSMWGRVDMEMELTVNREGRVFIPKAGNLACNDLTLDELEKRLKNRLSDVYSEFNLSVTLGKVRSIKVYVYGEVKQPGGYVLSSLSTLFNALYEARGPNERGSLRKIRLLRDGKTISEVDLYDFLLHGNAGGNVKLESEDVIFVPLAGDLVEIRGEVKRPAIYELRGGETIRDVIGLAGGMTPEAFASRIMVDRIAEADGRFVQDIDLATTDSSLADAQAKAGDRVTVYPMDGMHRNAVWLVGHVKHPGAYQLEQRTYVSDLIFNGDQLYDDCYWERADLVRTLPNGKKELIPVNLGDLVSNEDEAGIALQVGDSLVVYSVSEVERTRYVTIKGEVQKPGEYRLFENMKLSDLIFRAGNLKRNAFMLSAEVARITPSGTTELYKANLEKLITEQDESYDIALAEDDRVFIRSIPSWETNNTVTVDGEVRFPGEYVISYKGETLYEMIMRAGGVTDKAFPQGAVFTRAEISTGLERKNFNEIITKSAPLKEDSTGRIRPELVFDFDPKRMNRIVIDLRTVLESQGRIANISLRPADVIYIPETPSGVQVMGAVASSGTIQFVANQKPSYFIDRAGGFLRNSDRDGTRLVKADGRVLTWSKANGREVDLGDAIVVPTEVKKDRDWWKILTSTATIIGGLATTVYIVDKL